jgi:hypothetical protein
MSEVEPFVNPFGDFERITLEDCKNKFTEDELKQLKEHGQHVVVRPHFVDFWNDLPNDILEKFNLLFRKWVDSEVRHKTDKNGIVIEIEIIDPELNARKNFPDFFEIYFKDEEIKDDKSLRDLYERSESFDVLGLYLTFIKGLGINIHIEAEEPLNPEERSIIANYDKKTGVSIITEQKHYKQIKSLDIPGQQRMKFHEDGSISIVHDNENDTIAKALRNKKNKQGYNSFLLEAIGCSIEQAYKEGASGAISIPREGLQQFLHTTIRKPTQEIIDFIVSGKEPKTKEEKTLYDNIMKSYSFWVDLLNLTKAGSLETEDGSVVMIFNFERYNAAEDMIECDSPYLRHVYEDIYSHPIEGQKKNNEPVFSILKKSQPLLMGSFYTIKNDITKEIIEEIIRRLAKRGSETDAKRKSHYNYEDKSRISVKITYKSLIEHCPLLAHKLNEKVIKKDGTLEEPDAQYKRVMLSRAIFGETKPSKKSKTKTNEAQRRDEYKSLIEAVLHEHTALFEYYVGFSVTVDKISLKALNRTGITVRHSGISGDYKDNPTLHNPEVIMS